MGVLSMKYFQVVLFLSLFLITNLFSQVTCNQFKINYSVKHDKLKLKLLTDLPDDTNILVKVTRAYWKTGNSTKENEYYFDERYTIGEFKKVNDINVSDEVWEKNLKESQRETLELWGENFTVSDKDDDIRVMIFLNITNQTNPAFGRNLSKLMSSKIDLYAEIEGYRVMHGNKRLFDEVKIKRPLKGNVKYSTTKNFRNQPKLLNEFEVSQMIKNLGFHSEYSNTNGDFTNNFEALTKQGERIINDFSSGLMWRAKSSGNFVNFKTAESWIFNLNNKKSAGFNDWRLPTLEEAMTLIEKNKNTDGLFLDPLFGYIVAIWTSDGVKDYQNNGTEAWLVELRNGFSTRMDKIYEQGEALAVRSNSTLAPSTITEEKLRDQAKTLTIEDIKIFLKKYNLFDNNINPTSSGYSNNFTLKPCGSSNFVIDENTDLMWMPAPFGRPMTCIEAMDFSRMASTRELLGVSGWRLPTLEEAMTLLEKTKNKFGLHISDFFSEKTKRIWTCDEAGKQYAYWIVDFETGSCHISDGYKYDKYQRNNLLFVKSSK